MEYAVIDHNFTSPGRGLVDAKYLNPDYKYNFGYRFGVGYNSPCDGWDVNLLWTHLNARSTSSIDITEPTEKLVALWSALAPISEGDNTIPIANGAKTNWTARFNIIDLQLGREFWISKLLSLRPYLAFRGASINQKYEIDYLGGNFSFDTIESNAYGQVRLKNDFEGVGPLVGLDVNFHLRCGWSIFGNLATSVLYGKFYVDHEENLREAVSPFSKITVIDAQNDFKASRAALDLFAGVQWQTLVCNCKYGFTGLLSWEQHLFFHQNQMWRVERRKLNDPSPLQLPNNTGENVHNQRRGTFATGGLTLTFKFDF